MGSRIKLLEVKPIYEKVVQMLVSVLYRFVNRKGPLRLTTCMIMGVLSLRFIFCQKTQKEDDW